MSFVMKISGSMTKAETSVTAALVNSRVLRKCLGIYVSQARLIWKQLSPSLRDQAFGRAYGKHLHRMVRIHADRKQYFATFFFRNRPELRLLGHLLDHKLYGSRVDMSVLACSKGAEVYSMAWAIRSTRPDLQLNLHAVDISQEIVDFASKGSYSLESHNMLSHEDPQVCEDSQPVEWNTFRDQETSLFERMSTKEMNAMFEMDGNKATVRSHLKQGITWICGDAGSSSLNAVIGPQDIVVANRFLCHMRPRAAETCLRNIARMVKPGGYLFVSGIDLDVRTRVALDLGLQPVPDLLRQIHDGDDSIRRGWPVEYWGLEPLDDHRMDWQIRYASVFKVGQKMTNEYAELAGDVA
jgi:chemotaxis methyl-accepting protein methylase